MAKRPEVSSALSANEAYKERRHEIISGNTASEKPRFLHLGAWRVLFQLRLMGKPGSARLEHTRPASFSQLSLKFLLLRYQTAESREKERERKKENPMTPRDQAQAIGVRRHHSGSSGFVPSLSQSKKIFTPPTYHLTIRWARVALCPQQTHKQEEHACLLSTSWICIMIESGKEHVNSVTCSTLQITATL